MSAGSAVLGSYDDRSTVPRLLVEQAERLGHKPIIRFHAEAVDISYAGLVSAAEAGSARLRQEFHLEPGTSAAIFLSNGPSFIQSWFCSLFAGLVDIPINHEFKKETLRFGLAAAEAKVIFTDQSGVNRLVDDDVATYLPRLQLIVLCAGGDARQAEEALSRFSERPQVITLEELIAPGRNERLWECLSATSLASIRYTSGTTGAPKGIMHNHLHLLNKSANHARVLEYAPSDVLYSPFPLHHSLASTMGMMSTLQVGGTMVSAIRFSASRYWEAAAASGATIGHILFPLIPVLLAQPAAESDRRHSVRYLWTAWPHREFETRFNTTLVQIYALAEIGLVAYQRGGRDEGSRCVGPPLPVMETRIVDAMDRPLLAGEQGEITVRPREPHHLMQGYYNNFAATIRSFRNLWLHTGDLGYLGDNGDLYFLGRLGDSIRRRGVNISSEQIDEVILRYPALQECAAVGVPSELGEDDIKVFVVWRTEPVDLDLALRDLLIFMEEQLPKQYVPRYIAIAKALPRTNTGKFQKAALRDAPAKGPVWDRERHCWLPESASGA